MHARALGHEFNWSYKPSSSKRLLVVHLAKRRKVLYTSDRRLSSHSTYFWDSGSTPPLPRQGLLRVDRGWSEASYSHQNRVAKALDIWELATVIISGLVIADVSFQEWPSAASPQPIPHRLFRQLLVSKHPPTPQAHPLLSPASSSSLYEQHP